MQKTITIANKVGKNVIKARLIAYAARPLIVVIIRKYVS